MARLELKGLAKSYGAISVIKNLDLEIANGEFVSFVGPSGCGKSTLLRMICGIESLNDGEILIDGQPVGQLAPKDRGVSMVFQSYALYPHMTVRQNMGYALKLTRMRKAEIAERVNEAARTLQIEPLLDRYPRQLSGGQRQRVAIGRCITRQPRIFLFDEPLSNLDASLRTDMRAEIARLANRLKTTMVYVTHDQTEAMTLSDRIVILDQGDIQQVDEPDRLYRNPVNRFVAAFIGSPRINFIDGALSPGGPFRPTGATHDIQIINKPVRETSGGLELGVRPEQLTIMDAGSGGIPGKVALVERIGADGFAHIDSPCSSKPVIVRIPHHVRPRAGEAVTLSASLENAHLFDRAGARITADLPLTDDG